MYTTLEPSVWSRAPGAVAIFRRTTKEHIVSIVHVSDGIKDVAISIPGSLDTTEQFELTHRGGLFCTIGPTGKTGISASPFLSPGAIPILSTALQIQGLGHLGGSRWRRRKTGSRKTR